MNEINKIFNSKNKHQQKNYAYLLSAVIEMVNRNNNQFFLLKY